MEYVMQQRLSVVTLGVKELNRARAFYEALGWQVGAAEGEIVFFQLNGLILALYPREALAEDAQVPQSPAAGVCMTLAQNVESPEQVDAVLALARQAGGRVTKPGQKVFWGGYSGYFSDPDGHMWEIAHNPFWSIDDQGNIHL
ncbi:VOC family protein [Marinobacterium stanieri]|uniref:VOC family protein n=1 Tax=Marinobacterium stanieri TaxID=49186 RepID=UPI0002557C5C|nr:VOC family protein [Marinobacterium stanieri]